MGDLFEWDPAKASSNLEKHAVSFEEAQSVFLDTTSLTIPDPLHSNGEQRFITIGISVMGTVLVVVHTDRDDRIRLISARRANRRERKVYEQNNG